MQGIARYAKLGIFIFTNNPFYRFHLFFFFITSVTVILTCIFEDRIQCHVSVFLGFFSFFLNLFYFLRCTHNSLNVLNVQISIGTYLRDYCIKFELEKEYTLVKQIDNIYTRNEHNIYN